MSFELSPLTQMRLWTTLQMWYFSLARDADICDEHNFKSSKAAPFKQITCGGRCVELQRSAAHALSRVSFTSRIGLGSRNGQLVPPSDAMGLHQTPVLRCVSSSGRWGPFAEQSPRFLVHIRSTLLAWSPATPTTLSPARLSPALSQHHPPILYDTTYSC